MEASERSPSVVVGPSPDDDDDDALHAAPIAIQAPKATSAQARKRADGMPESIYLDKSTGARTRRS
ncbi:hypothetical protein AKJ09_06193 [Labilithrix luteola]|uniref:Uncharacterized protein n=1 Tax=Labilithrix luteola TaxID=1391654 RepID=A0A0K1Q2B7_9BACT|nr:hypothetical protein AKJ09_06193 [Labilithrix luteola]